MRSMTTPRRPIDGHREREGGREDEHDLQHVRARARLPEDLVEHEDRGEDADHEDVAVREVDELDDAVHHRVAQRDQGVDRAAREAVDELGRPDDQEVEDGQDADEHQRSESQPLERVDQAVDERRPPPWSSDRELPWKGGMAREKGRRVTLRPLVRSGGQPAPYCLCSTNDQSPAPSASSGSTT